MAGRLRGLIVLASGLLLVLGGCSTGDPAPEPDPGPDTTVDLLGQDWQHVPGVSGGADGLAVRATGTRIVEQDGGGGQPDPPLNLAGTHLLVGREFALSAAFADVTADATWALYDRPPVIADEFRIEPAGVRLTLRGDDLDIAVWDGSRQEDVTRPRPAHDQRVTVADPAAALTVRRSGDQLTVGSGRDVLATLPLGGVFRSGELWLGLSSEQGSFRVVSLAARAPGDSRLRTAGPAVMAAEPEPEGLQALADRVRPGFRIGAAVALGPLAGDPDYAREVVSTFGAVTPENAMKPQFLSPQQGVYTFEEADAVLAVAERHGMAVHGHTITFSEALPRWMRELPTGTPAEREASGAALLDYVRTVVTHFKGRLASLDVVNEPLDTDQGTELQQNVWYRVFGPEYPVVVSQAVHEADSDVAQYANENGAEVPGERQDALLQLALDTNARGGHLTGVGLQAHVYDLGTDAISDADLTSTLQRFQDHGLRVRISENDVTDDEGTDAQAEQYATVLTSCLRSPNCVSWTTWGVDDRYDWWTDDDGVLQQGHDLLFDDGRPTAAHEAMRQALGG